jgi:hypothetical protein
MHSLLDIYIANLLYDYDCVVVPQLGGFVTNYRPARIDEKAGMAYPAGKDIRFNRNLTKNDGLLTTAVARAEGITFEAANEVIHAAVEQTLTHMQGGQQVKFNKIGVLYFDDHRNMRFEPFNDHNFYRGSFGMEPFALPAVSKKAEVPPFAVDSEIKTDSIPEKKETPVIAIEIAASQPRRSNTVYKVAAATLLPFIGMSLYLGFTTNFKSPTEISVADLNPFAGKASAIKTPSLFTMRSERASAENLDSDTIAFPDNSVFPFSFEYNRIDSTGVWVNMKGISPAELAHSSATTLSGNTYHVIGGCFGSEANAGKFIDQMTELGYQSEILDYHKGLHRVRVASFDNYTEALQNLDALRSKKELSGAWLLKKPLK